MNEKYVEALEQYDMEVRAVKRPRFLDLRDRPGLQAFKGIPWDSQASGV